MTAMLDCARNQPIHDIDNLVTLTQHPTTHVQRRAGEWVNVGLSKRDRSIIALARRNLDGAHANFSEILRAVHAAVQELIPSGRIYLLGTTDFGPIIGSLVSGVGIVDDPKGVVLVRVHPGGQRITLARF